MSSNKTFSWQWLAIGLGLVALFSIWLFLPVADWLKSFQTWVQAQGLLGYVLFGAIYVIATVLLMPGALLTLAAGLAFGLWGFPLVVVAATIGASLAFLISRYVARGAVERRFGEHKRFKAIDAAISEEGWKVVGLLRLSPLIPFNLQNYLYGLTDIKFWHSTIATFIGIMPGTLMYVYFGAAGNAALSGEGDGGDPLLKWTLFAAGLVATIAVTVLVTGRAKAKLDELGVDAQTEGEQPMINP